MSEARRLAELDALYAEYGGGGLTWNELKERDLLHQLAQLRASEAQPAPQDFKDSNVSHERDGAQR